MGNEIETQEVETPEKTPDQILNDLAEKSADKVFVSDETTAKPTAAKTKETPAVKVDESGKDDKLPGKNGELDENTLNDFREGKIIPKHRLDEVLTRESEMSQRLKMYESFGTLEEIKQILHRILKGETKTDPVSTPKEELTQEDKDMQSYLLKLMPQLKDLPNVMDQMTANIRQQEEEKAVVYTERETQYNSFLETSTNAVKALAKEAGIDVEDPTVFTTVMNGITFMINNNKDLDKMFYADRNPEAIKKAFEDFNKKFFSGIQRKAASNILKDKTKQEKLPKPPAPGALTSAPAEEPAKSLEEAGERAVRRVFES